MLADHVEAELLGDLDVVLQGLVGRGGVNAVGPESLVERADLEKGTVTVTARLAGDVLGNTYLSVEVFDGDKSIAKEGGLENSYVLKIPKAKLWSPESPHLYGLRVHVSGMRKASGSDTVTSYFAMREVKLDKDRQ
ncbi:MAG TPA: hypothetical protein VKD72_25560, partial [Gemmataceae bacterium]|nr:hypothetical protein [Gemmataceae bacterium]